MQLRHRVVPAVLDQASRALRAVTAFRDKPIASTKPSQVRRRITVAICSRNVTLLCKSEDSNSSGNGFWAFRLRYFARDPAREHSDQPRENLLLLDGEAGPYGRTIRRVPANCGAQTPSVEEYRRIGCCSEN